MTQDQQTVLIVEDEHLIRMVLADALENAGYYVLEASNALEAIGIGNHPSIDVVITDVDMPGALDGLDLMRLVSLNYRHTAIVVTSGGRYLNSAELSPGVCFLPKPYNLGLLIAEIAFLMSRPHNLLKAAKSG
jgi:DNA-binding response OmpR family regulator